jgi:hypothetical protein
MWIVWDTIIGQTLKPLPRIISVIRIRWFYYELPALHGLTTHSNSVPSPECPWLEDFKRKNYRHIFVCFLAFRTCYYLDRNMTQTNAEGKAAIFCLLYRSERMDNADTTMALTVWDFDLTMSSRRRNKGSHCNVWKSYMLYRFESHDNPYLTGDRSLSHARQGLVAKEKRLKDNLISISDTNRLSYPPDVNASFLSRDQGADGVQLWKPPYHIRKRINSPT